MEQSVLNRFNEIKKRLSLLEKAVGLNGEGFTHPPIEVSLTLPEADIGGLHFNAQEVKAAFENGEDGWWSSRDVLFLSARNVEDDNSRDILTEYLESDAVRDCFIYALSYFEIGNYTRGDLEISLPVRNEGVKRYNGVDCWYWLKGTHSEYTSSFCAVNHYGNDTVCTGASEVGGCAPRFRIKGADV